MFAAETSISLTLRPNHVFLQWGRRMFAAETRRPPTSTILIGSLQWGRRMFAAETMTPSGLTNASHCLQWGRRMFAAETRRRRSTTRSSGTFNGAAACSRRRHVLRQGVPRLSAPSMGPPHVRGGDSPPTPKRSAEAVLQWGRRMFAAETTSSRRRVTGRSGTFNGAAACSRRRPGWTTSLRGSNSALQWGRRMFAAETTSITGCSRNTRSSLQWGRRMFAAETPFPPYPPRGKRGPSMGPPHVRGGDQRWCVRGGTGRSPFNGAAACSRRRRA